MNLSSNKTLAGVIIGVVIAFFVMFGGWLGLLWLLPVSYTHLTLPTKA